ncbi:DNA primase [Streptococcus dysgalactiae]|nr:DNA primase [Streptococcus dysgalactiae]
MTKQKEITTFNVQVAEFIRHHKKEGTAIDDDVTKNLSFHLLWMLIRLMTYLSVNRWWYLDYG